MMKKRLVPLLLVSIISSLYAEWNQEINSQMHPIAKWMLNDRRLSSKKREQLLKRCGCFDKIPSKRGKRGKKGPRGRRGRSGENACGLGELFLNAPIMASSGEGLGYPPDSTFTPYSPIDTSIPAWQVSPSTSSATPVEGIFNIPIDLDRTQPVTVVMHFLVPSVLIPSGQARLRVDMIYLPNNDLLGFIPPATGFDDTQFSADFFVAAATPVFSNNLRHISVSVVLDPTRINGDWAFIGVRRVAPAEIEFEFPLFLSTISIQYSRICSE